MEVMEKAAEQIGKRWMWLAIEEILEVESPAWTLFLRNNQIQGLKYSERSERGEEVGERVQAQKGW